jgi:propionyl-CoA synthetase
VISQHPDVCEVAVVGVRDSLKGQIPVGLVILHQRVEDVVDHHHPRIEQELIAMIRDKIGPVAVFKKALFVKRLPKTRYGICSSTLLCFALSASVVSLSRYTYLLFVTNIVFCFRSGKILRGVMRNIADRDEYKVPATIEDMSVLQDIEHLLLSVGDPSCPPPAGAAAPRAAPPPARASSPPPPRRGGV